MKPINRHINHQTHTSLKQGLFTRIFISLRRASCPFGQLVSHVPTRGSILDAGCGFGIFTLLLAERNPKQRIIGVDPDNQRTETASQSSKNYPKLTFLNGSLFKTPFTSKFDVITINDVLYLMPPKEKTRMVIRSYQLLKPHGKLSIKFNPRSFSFRYFLTWLQEIITVKLLRKTVSEHSGLYFESESEVVNLLLQNKFHIEKIVHLSTPFPFFHPHELIIGVK